MKQKIVKLIAAFVLMMGALGTLVSGVAVYAEGKKHVMTTFYPVYYLAERIGGDKVEVSMLLEGNEDPHDYETSAKDAAKVQEADLFIYQDDEMEHFVSDLTKLIDLDKTKVVKATEGIELMKGAEDDHDHEHENEGEDHEHESEDHDHEHEHHHEYDPHTWLDPMLYKKEAQNVLAALVKMDPDNKDTYEKNAKELETELDALNEEFNSKLAQLENKTIVVQHAAFGYLAHAYGLTQEAITGIQTTQEPSAAALAEMQNFVKEHNVKVIYVEPGLSDAIAKTVAEASGAELLPLRTMETVTQQEIEKGATYFTIMQENLKQLLKN